MDALSLLAWAWAAAALAWELRAARPARPPDRAVARGSARRGLVWFFTAGMRPEHKESVRRHPAEFVIGVVLHAAVLVALPAMLAAALAPALAAAFLARAWPLLALGALAGLALVVRRAAVRDLRAMSVPEDYLAALATCGLLAVAAACGLGAPLRLGLLYTTLLLVYLPLGKLRHAVFFFAARADQGRRLGFRGVLPPAAEARE